MIRDILFCFQFVNCIINHLESREYDFEGTLYLAREL